MEKFAFLSSTRFWAMVIGAFTIAANGEFTPDAWAKAICALITGFVAIRTIDRNTGDTK